MIKVEIGPWYKLLNAQQTRIMSVIKFKKNESDQYISDTFYRGLDQAEKPYYFLNDKWLVNELRDNSNKLNKITEEEFAPLKRQMIGTILEGRVKDDSK